MDEIILEHCRDNLTRFSTMTDVEIYNWMCDNFYTKDYEMVRKCSRIIFDESRQIQIFKGRFCMLKGKKVYDPLTNTWSTGYWLPIYDNRGYIVQYVPVWKD